MRQQRIKLNTISALADRIGLSQPAHPLIMLVNTGAVSVLPEDNGKIFIIDFYKISFKKDFKGQVRYGQGHYEFEEGGLSFTAPHQLSVAENYDKEYEGYTLFFHPELIRNYPLGKGIGKYGFFSYAVSEALFLSDQEKKTIGNLFEEMAGELNNEEGFSQDVIVSQLELLLNYSNKYYHRQFVTRKGMYNDLIDNMNLFLKTREPKGLPTVQEVANHLQVSKRYLTDMLKSLTGMSTQQHIHHQIIEMAKDSLSTGEKTIAEIAYQLGFEHPQSFNKLFKQKAKVSPIEFRQSFKNP